MEPNYKESKEYKEYLDYLRTVGIVLEQIMHEEFDIEELMNSIDAFYRARIEPETAAQIIAINRALKITRSK